MTYLETSDFENIYMLLSNTDKWLFILMHAIYKEKNSRILIILKLRNSTNQILF